MFLENKYSANLKPHIPTTMRTIKFGKVKFLFKKKINSADKKKLGPQ